MTKLITIKLINGDLIELSTDKGVDYEEIVNNMAVTFMSEGTENLIPLSSVIKMEVKNKE